MMHILHLCLFFLHATRSLAATKDDWRGRTIYQVFTDRFARTDGSSTAACDVSKNAYCGGTWQGIINNLDWIKNMGFTAIWISPVTKNMVDGYHGYWQTDITALNDNFGTAQDLKDLSAALHSRGMLLMVDVVQNHLGTIDMETPDVSKYKPFNSMDHFHSYCNLTNYQDQTMSEDCWVGPELPDIKTEDSWVRDQFSSWISSLVSTYGIDGLRIDSVKNVEKDFQPIFCAAAGVFCFGEVSDGNAAYTYPYQDVMDSVTDYPNYYAMSRVFKQQSDMSDLAYSHDMCKNGGSSGCRDSTVMGKFIENHDNPRFPHGTSDIELAKNVLAYTILTDGIPIIYQGQEHHLAGDDDPYCREAIWLSGFSSSRAPLHDYIAILNEVRNRAALVSSSYLTYQNFIANYTTSVIQMRKDIVRTVLTNDGLGGSTYDLTTSNLGFTSGESVIEVVNCDTLTADSTGNVAVKISNGGPKVLVPASYLSGSNICGH